MLFQPNHILPKIGTKKFDEKSVFLSHLFLSENSQPALWDQMVSGEPTWDNRGGPEVRKPK